MDPKFLAVWIFDNRGHYPYNLFCWLGAHSQFFYQQTYRESRILQDNFFGRINGAYSFELKMVSGGISAFALEIASPAPNDPAKAGRLCLASNYNQWQKMKS